MDPKTSIHDKTLHDVAGTSILNVFIALNFHNKYIGSLVTCTQDWYATDLLDWLIYISDLTRCICVCWGAANQLNVMSTCTHLNIQTAQDLYIT
jgi:hypothetical protein